MRGLTYGSIGITPATMIPKVLFGVFEDCVADRLVEGVGDVLLEGFLVRTGLNFQWSDLHLMASVFDSMAGHSENGNAVSSDKGSWEGEGGSGATDEFGKDAVGASVLVGYDDDTATLFERLENLLDGGAALGDERYFGTR